MFVGFEGFMLIINLFHVYDSSLQFLCLFDALIMSLVFD